MKKILAIMLIAVIAVAGAFAVAVNTADAPTSIKLTYNVNDYFKPSFAFSINDGETTSPDSEVNIADEDTAKGGTTTGIEFNLTPTSHDANSTDGIVANSVTLNVLDKSKSNSYSDDVNSVKLTFTFPTAWTRASGSTADTGDETSNITTDTAFTAVTGVTGSTVTPGSAKDFTVKYAKGLQDRTSNGTKIATIGLNWTDANVAAGAFEATITVAYVVD